MARLQVHADRLVIQLTRGEQVLAMHRGDLVIDRSRITSAIITDDPWVWLRGSRVIGSRILGRTAFGTWRHLSGKDFALLRKGRHAVVIDLDEASAAASGDFDDHVRVIVSTEHAADLVRALRLEQPGEHGVFTTETL